MDRYKKYSKYLREKYGEKVYKIPINLPITCPNRDGTAGNNGCIFCGEIGAGFESLDNSLSVYRQLEKNIQYISNKYNASKFIAYFQNYTNTYMELEYFEKVMVEAGKFKDVVEICISTRPDSISREYLEILEKVKNKHNVNISIELGLQTVNYKTLKKINRGHSLAEFIDTMMMINSYEFDTCAHLILNLPWDDLEDTVEAAKIISALGLKQVKIHSLYVLKYTKLGRMFEKKEIKIISVSEYVDRVVEFLKYLNPEIAVQRLVGRAPKDDTLFCNWEMSWWRIQDLIEEKMKKEDIYQGMYYNYLGGKAVRRFL